VLSSSGQSAPHHRRNSDRVHHCAERINCTRKAIREATENRDAAFITEQATLQAAVVSSEGINGYIDVNAGAHPDTELDNMLWLLDIVQKATPLPITLDSPSPKVLQAGLEALDGRLR